MPELELDDDELADELEELLELLDVELLLELLEELDDEELELLVEVSPEPIQAESMSDNPVTASVLAVWRPIGAPKMSLNMFQPCWKNK